MKISKLLIMLAVGLILASTTTSCFYKVPAGNVGIKFHLLGGDKGVDAEELNPGRYWIGINTELYLFPTFTQNYVWTAGENEGSKNNEEIVFQTSAGLECSADVGITYHLDTARIANIFAMYKRGIDEITDIFLRNMVRDAFVDAASIRDVEQIYGPGKKSFVDTIQNVVYYEVRDIGIIIDKIYLVGNVRVPDGVKLAIDAKVKATQDAQMRENQIRETIAEAQKKIEAARGDSLSYVIRAAGEAEANRVLSRSITTVLIDYNKINNWNGVLPQVTGGGMPIIDMRNK